MTFGRKFYEPLADGAPKPKSEINNDLERVIHFFPPHLRKVTDKLDEISKKSDVILGNLEDGISPKDKIKARKEFVKKSKEINLRNTGLWTRVNAISSEWFLDDISFLIKELGNTLDVIMLPMINTPEEILFADRIIALNEAQNKLKKQVKIHIILETAEGVMNVESLAACSPRLHGFSLGPADLAASRGMKTVRVGGSHPDYGILSDPKDETTKRKFIQQDLWHYSLSKMIDACSSNNIKAFFGPYGDFDDAEGCEIQFRNAFILGCHGAWSLHPSQIDIAKKVFCPSEDEVEKAAKIIKAMGDGTGAVKVDGKMQDEATVKQANVIIELAKKIRKKDPKLSKSFSKYLT